VGVGGAHDIPLSLYLPSRAKLLYAPAERACRYTPLISPLPFSPLAVVFINHLTFHLGPFYTHKCLLSPRKYPEGGRGPQIDADHFFKTQWFLDCLLWATYFLFIVCFVSTSLGNAGLDIIKSFRICRAAASWGHSVPPFVWTVTAFGLPLSPLLPPPPPVTRSFTR
jgi:hypothetical protein